MSKAKEFLDLVEQEHQPSLPGIPGGRIPPEKGSYPFLKVVKDPKKLASGGYSGLEGIKYDGSGEISIAGDEPDIIINYNSKSVAKEFLTLDKKLTKEIQEAFDSYDSGGWKDWREKWVESKGWKVGDYGSGNTYNEDNHYFWGDTYEWTVFEDNKGKSGIIIQWHLGGDVRGNYSYPEVWMGDPDGFMMAQQVSDPDEEIAYIFGYEGDKEGLLADIAAWKEENYEK